MPSSRIVGAVDRLARLVERPRDARDRVVGHVRVDPPGQLHELGVQVERLGAPREVERVDRDAVAAQARARPEGHEPEGLGRGRARSSPRCRCPSGRPRIAISLTSAMFTARNVFSTILDISALSGDETTWTVSQTWRVQLRGAAGALGGHAAHDLGRVADARTCGLPGIDALGRERQEHVLADASAGALQDGRDRPRGWCPDRSCSRAPAARPARGARPPSRRPRAPTDRSGLRCSSRGVGRQMMIASQSASSGTRPWSPGTGRWRRPPRGPRPRRPRCRSGRPRSAATLRASTSTPDHVRACLREGDGQGQADVAQPDDADTCHGGGR